MEDKFCYVDFFFYIKTKHEIKNLLILLFIDTFFLNHFPMGFSNEMPSAAATIDGDRPNPQQSVSMLKMGESWRMQACLMPMANWTSELPYEAIVDVSFFFHEMSITDDASSRQTLLSTSSEIDRYCSDSELTVRSHTHDEDICRPSNLFAQFAPSLPILTDDHCYSTLGFANPGGNNIQNDYPKDVAFVNSVNMVRTPENKQSLDSKLQRSRSEETRRKHMNSMKRYDIELLNSMQEVSAEPVASSNSDEEKKGLLPFSRRTRKDDISKTNVLAGYTKRQEVRPSRISMGRDATIGHRRDREMEMRRYKKLV
jgi:hypothetical protein